MTKIIYTGLFLLATIAPVVAQPASEAPPGHAQPRPDGAQWKTPEEIDALYAAAQKRSDAENIRRTKLMAHWTYAVCIGCGAAPKPFKTVYTHPLRVLAGIPAWTDDERANARRGAVRPVVARGEAKNSNGA